MSLRFRCFQFLLAGLALFGGQSAGRALGSEPSPSARPASVSVAAAANLVFALEALHAEFKRAHPDVTLTTATGASGSLYAQIKNGAPFDVFLSADTEYPNQIVAAGLGDVATLQTFATGRLVAWTMRKGVDLSNLTAAVRDPAVKKIALAQPKTAPYGRAAQATLEKLGLWQDAQAKLVRGESISQTTQFVETGNADFGFIAMSVVTSPRLKGKGRWVEIPPEDYAEVPLDHAAVLTTRGAANPAAKSYLEFLGRDAAKKILREFGYGVK